jgi:hypothetical protein
MRFSVHAVPDELGQRSPVRQPDIPIQNAMQAAEGEFLIGAAVKFIDLAADVKARDTTVNSV